MNNYDIEMGIPSGQLLHNTVQGNWGLSTDANNAGMTTEPSGTTDFGLAIGNNGIIYSPNTKEFHSIQDSMESRRRGDGRAGGGGTQMPQM